MENGDVLREMAVATPQRVRVPLKLLQEPLQRGRIVNTEEEKSHQSGLGGGCQGTPRRHNPLLYFGVPCA